MITKIHINSPVFVIGNPRSGTSLLRLMLTNHPEICIPPECGFLQWWYDKYRNWSIKDSVNRPRVTEYIDDLSVSKKIETWNIDYKDLAERILTFQPANYAELSSLPYLEYAKSRNKYPLYWGDKNNYYIGHLELLLSIYPEAKFIFIIRDGRDVACSYRNLNNLKTESPYKPKLSQNIRSIAEEWSGNNKIILNFSRQLNSNKHFIRYEDLVLHSKSELHKICEFLQIPFSEEMLHYFEKNILEETEPKEMMDWKKKTLEKPDVSNIGKYVHMLTSEEVSIFNSSAREILNYFNYE